MATALATVEQSTTNHMGALRTPALALTQVAPAGQQGPTLQLPIQQNTPPVQVQTSTQEEDLESDSETKDRELSEEDSAQQDPTGTQLFHPDQFPKHLYKVLQTLNCLKKDSPPSEASALSTAEVDCVLPVHKESTRGFPLHKFFAPLIVKEWANQGPQQTLLQTV